VSTSNCVHVRLLVLLILFSACARGSFAQINITTERYDQSRLGANLSETLLNTSNVNVNTFGKLWSYQVSGSVYAQPLYVQNVTIPGKGTHNVLYVVTMNDVVYAFDADSSSNTPLLSLDLTTQVAGSTPVPITDIVGPGLVTVGNVGIESTPYIDLSTNTMYLVARTKEPVSTCGTVNGNYCQRLHALDMTTFAEKFGGPIVIQGTVPGTGSASVGGTLTFDPKIHQQRSSLALANGQIFVAWASHEDLGPYHGWVMSYNASNLQQTGIWCSSPDGFMGGVWMSGWGPAVDASGNVYYTVGNGDWNGTRNFGESMVKFGSTPGMPLLDWFTLDNWYYLNAADTDYGSSGPILIPGTDLIASAGKSSIFYVMHTGNLGHLHANNSQIVQSFGNNGGEVKGGPVYWNRSGGAGPWMYVWSNSCDFLKAYHFKGTTFGTGIVSESTIASPCGASGGVLTLSANGSTAGSGIIWSSMPLLDDADHGVHQGVLRAFNADDLTKELWNSNMNAARDDSGNWPKYTPPTVVNGRVYMASFPADGVSSVPLNVYGLQPPGFTISATPASQGVSPGGSASYTVSTSSIFNFFGAVTLSVTGLPSGASASFAANNFATPGSTKLTVNTSSSTPLGTNILTITGTSGSQTHTATVSLVVTTVTPGTGTISIDFVGRDTPMAFTEVAGVLPKSNWNEAQGSSGNGFALVDETGTPTGATVSWTSSKVWNLPIANTPGNFRMMNGSIEAIGLNTTVMVAGLPANAAGYDVYVYADGDNGGATRTGIYQISGTGITTTSINLTDAANTNFSGTFTKANNSAGNYVVFYIATTGFTLTAIPSTASDGTQRAPVNGMQIIPHATTPDFALAVSPSSQTVQAGNPTTYTVTTTANNSFNGTVTLSASGLPSGATASFSPATITGAGTSTLTVSTGSATPAGTSALMVGGSSGSLVHSASVTLVVNTLTPAAPPVFSPAGGSYSSPQSVTITDSTAGATIYYTTNGSTPTTSSTTYTGAISVSSTTTIMAIATATGFSTSAVASATYNISGSLLLIPQTGWTLKFVDSQETTGENGAATNAFDGKTNTFWVTQWFAANPPPPHEIQINLGATYTIKGFTYLPRQDGCSNGTVSNYEFYVSSDGVNWGAPVAAGTFNYGVTFKCGGGPILPAQQINFTAVSATYVRFRALSEVSGSPWTSVAEISLISAAAPGPVVPASVTLSPAATLSGMSVQGSVTLNGAAPAGGLMVTLANSNPAVATVPASVAVAAGQTTGTFSISTVPGSIGNVTITATANGSTASSTLTVQSPIAQTGWTLKFVDSQETTGENGAATNAFDGKTNTFWVTQWFAANPPPPHEIQINLGATYTINGFTYLPRQDGCSNGTVSNYEFYVSSDGVNWGAPVAAGTFNYGVTFKCGGGPILPAQQINFTAVSATYVRFRALSEVSGYPWTSVVELNVLH
jgi:hypothetical protein